MPDLESDSLTTGGPFKVAVEWPVQRGYLAIWDLIFSGLFNWKLNDIYYEQTMKAGFTQLAIMQFLT